MNPISEHTLSRPESTDYPLQGDEVDWFTGVTSSGNQLLVIYQFPDVVVVAFTPDGHLSGLSSPPGMPIDADAGFFSMKDDDILRSWLLQMGFRTALINVKRFTLPQHHIDIIDLPSNSAKILLHPTLYSDEELAIAQQELKYWSNQGLFELWLNEFTNIWIDKAGAIVAT